MKIQPLEYTRKRLVRTSERLRGLVYPEARAPDMVLVAGPVDRIPLAEAEALAYRPTSLGERFGPLWSTFWFRVAATVPDEWRGRRVDLLWVTGCESTLWIDGRSVQGLNSRGGGERPEAKLLDPAAGGERLELRLELACNGMFGEQNMAPELQRSEIAVFDPDAWRLYHDFEVLRALEASGRVAESWAGELRAGLNRFCNEGDPAVLDELLAHRNGTRAHAIAAIGHAHIDTAWLWPLEETYRKTVRTFSSQTRYMDEYGEYRFACSQAQQYAWIKERNPDLWERVRAKVDAGQFVPVGGSWVEPDCNIPSGSRSYASS